MLSRPSQSARLTWTSSAAKAWYPARTCETIRPGASIILCRPPKPIPAMNAFRFSHRLPALCLCAALLAIAPGKARADEGPPRTYEIEAVENVTYYDGPNVDAKRHKCDVFYPRGGEKCPVVVLVHGGVW